MSEKTFEQNFAQLAEVHVKDKVPSLMEFWVGFQLLHKEENEESATGIMAFVLNKLWIYIPVIFIKGDLKGANILYIQNIDLCIPAQDNWINTLKEKGMGFLGNLADDLNSNKDYESIDDITIPVDEFAIKEASDNKIDPETLNKLFTRKKHKQIPFTEKLAMLGDQALITFANTVINNPEMANTFLTYHTPEELQKVSKHVAEVASRKQHDKSTDTKLTYIHSMTDKNAQDLSDTEKKVLVRNGLFIKDAREEVSKVFTAADTDAKFTNPDNNGNYRVLMRNGTYKNFYIINSGDTHCILLDKESGKGMERLKKDVFAESLDDKEPPTKQKATYRALAEEFKTDNNVQIILQQKDKVLTLRPDIFRDEEDNGTSLHFLCENVSVVPVFTGGNGKLSVHNKTLIIPEGVDMMTYTSPAGDKNTQLGDMDTIASALRMNDTFVPVKVDVRKETGTTIETGSEKEDYVDKTSALHYLTDRLGIFAGQAQQLIKQAEREGLQEYFVKLAAPYEGVVNPIKAKEVQTTVEMNKHPNMNELLPGQVVQQLTNKAQNGLAEVFDASIFESLLQSAGVSDFKQEFVTDMLKGMDSAARMLLLLYWNYEMFEERYEGKLDELEEKLKDLFITSGDVVLFIKEKTENLPEGGESVWGMLSEELM